jgi:N-acetylmuramoyl-L-alanine amidase
MDLNRRLFAARLAGAALAAGALGRNEAWADAPALLRGVRLDPTPEGVRASIGLDRPALTRTFFLSEPDRFVIDVANARWAMGGSGSGPGAGMVRGYRYAARPDGAARLVLDLEVPALLERQAIAGRSGGELSFDLAATAPFTQALEPNPQPAAPGRNGARRVIVVDAGHGGRDPGAVGLTGVREKDVVLDAALKLREALEARGRYQVALTRDSDRFIPLEDRVNFARAQNADLFISVHADSHANREAEGASVYTLSERGANRAQSMMAAQNWEIDLGAAPRGGFVGDILVDLAQRETTNRSAQFAEVVIRELGTVAPLLRNTHRNAGFFVLLAPDVPAVLIETGFLSNVQDERRLADPRARQNVAEAMAGAVDRYFTVPRTYAAG